MLDQLEAQRLLEEILKAVEGLKNAKAAMVNLSGAPIEIVVSTEDAARNAMDALLGNIKQIRVVRVNYLPEMVEKYGKIDLNVMFSLYMLILKKYGSIRTSEDESAMLVIANFAATERVQGASIQFAYFGGEPSE